MYLIQECENRGVSLFGAINAAALKAVATLKQVGSRGEHYGTAVLLQCRHRLDPVIPESSVGEWFHILAPNLIACSGSFHLAIMRHKPRNLDSFPNTNVHLICEYSVFQIRTCSLK